MRLAGFEGELQRLARGQQMRLPHDFGYAVRPQPLSERRGRLAAKFVEASHEKVDRLVELWFRAAGRLRAAEAELADGSDDEEEDAEEAEAERYAARLEGGLFTLQQLAATLGALWAHGHGGVNARALAALRLGGAALADVRTVLREAAAALGDDGEADETAAAELAAERSRMAELADLLVAQGEEAEEGDEPAEEAAEPDEPDEPAEKDGEQPAPPGSAAEGLLAEDDD